MGRKSGKARRYVVNSEERLPTPPAPQTAQDVRLTLGQVMSELLVHRLDPRTATSVAYVANVMLKAIEVSALEHRMDKLETLLRVDNSSGHPEN